MRIQSRVLRLLWLAAGLCLSGAPIAAAQTPSAFAYWQNDAGIVLIPLGEPIPDWRIQLLGGVAAMPLYEGSNRYWLVPSPGFDIRYKDIAFASAGDGLGVNLLRGQTYRAGAAINYDVGRSQHAAYRLNGIGSIPPAPELRLFAEAALLPFVFSVDLRKQLLGTEGIIGDLGVYMPVIGREELVVFVGPGATFANGTYMQKYFGIGTSQAAPHSHFSPYAADGGVKNANFGVSAIYHFTDEWYINADAGFERLLGSAAGSPIVQTRNQLIADLQIGYQF